MKEAKTIPWFYVEPKLPAFWGPARLGQELGVAKNVVGNWKTRGIPIRYARDLGRIIGVGIDELLDAAGIANPANSGRKTALSPEAWELILCVARLDRVGEIARKTFAQHTGLLLLSEAAAQIHDSSGEAEANAREAVRLLSKSIGQYEVVPDEHESKAS